MDYYSKYIKYKNKYENAKLPLYKGMKGGSHLSIQRPIVPLVCTTWNILSDGLAGGEFLSNRGDTEVIEWDKRGPKIVDTILCLFNKGTHILATQENDHPKWIHNKLLETNINIEYVFIPKYKEPGSSSSLKFLRKKLNKQPMLEYYEAADIDIGDDTIAIYYDKTKVILKSLQQHEIGKSLVGHCEFCIAGSDLVINVINGHLSSGEAKKDADTRVKECDKLMKYVYDLDNVILLFDSNSSIHYMSNTGDKKNDDVFDIWQFNKFTNVILPNQNLECLKMRHGNGGQPAKFGEFMFDTIDKIAYKSDMIKSAQVIFPEVNFQFYWQMLPPHEVAYLHFLRSNTERRAALKDLVTREAWSDVVGIGKMNLDGTLSEYHLDDNHILPQYDQRAMYPNTKAPSDHPPCTVRFEFKTSVVDNYAF
jgi:hypothetical protein